MRSRATSLRLLMLVLLLWAGGYARAQAFRPTEYQVKAAFLFNFAKFVEWPPQTFASADSPLVIGILGQSPLHGELARTVRGKSVDAHPVVVKALSSPLESTNCQILFISASETRKWPAILRALGKAGVLTVSETERFTQRGGMINFVLEGDRVRFQINRDAAARAGLKISSKLMSLALDTDR